MPDNIGFWNRDAVFIAGFRKCGTTTVFDYLAQFSDVLCPSRLKEPQYFALADMASEHAETWYCGLFDTSSRCILDGSTWLMTDPSSIEKARAKFKSNVSVIAMHREPIKRTLSAYRHMRKKGGNIESRSFSQVISDIENADGDDLWTREHHSILEAEKSGVIDTSYCDKNYLKRIYNIEHVDSHFTDKYIMFRYFGESLYDRYIDKLTAIKGDIRWLHLDMDSFIQDFKEREKLLDFLGIEADAEHYPITHSNQTTNNRVLLDMQENHKALYKALKKLLPQCIREKLKSNIAKNTDKVSVKDHKRTQALFSI